MKKFTGFAGIAIVLSLAAASLSYAETATTFNVSLGRNSNQTSEVLKLQQFLYNTGYLHVSPTGAFLSLTLQAVAAFQKSQGIEATGYFGPLTRAAANAKLAMLTPSQPPAVVSGVSLGIADSDAAATVLSDSRVISWHTENYPPNVGVNINLLQKTGINPIQYSLVRTIMKDAPNDGTETWTPLARETGSNMYIEVTCSTTNKFQYGCQQTNNLIPVN